MHSKHQKNLKELRRRFEAIAPDSVSVACFEFEFEKFDFGRGSNMYPAAKNGWADSKFHDKTASRYGEPSKFGRSWAYWWTDAEAFQTFKRVSTEAAYHLAGCRECQWAANYGISHDTLSSRPDHDLWTHSLFDLLKTNKHEAFDLPIKFQWVLNLFNSTGQPLEILQSRFVKKRKPTAEEKEILDGYGIHAKIDDLAFVSAKAIDRLTEYDAEGNHRVLESAGQSSVATVNLEKLNAKMPALKVESGDWLRARKENEEIFGLSVATLNSYRKVCNSGYVSACKMFGQDKDGRFWRRKGTPGSAVYYLKETLLKAGE